MLKELEKRLNDYWKDSEDEYYVFEVRKSEENNFRVICLDDLGKIYWEIQAEYNPDMAALIKNCISELYDEFINPQNKIVRAWKGYINRKVKSLGLAISNNNVEKVTKINLEMTEQYKKMMDAKFQVSEYKIFVTMLYIIKEEFEPTKEII